MIQEVKNIQSHVNKGSFKKMLHQTKWMYQYARHYWPAILFYTLFGLFGTLLGLASSLISKNLIDIITGQKNGMLVQTFCLMIGFNLANVFINQIISYASNWINMKVDADIKADIFSKMLITDWESLTNYHTGDLLTRWSNDASNISSGILNWIPNLLIHLFKFISSFAIILYYDATFAIFAFFGMPVSLLLSRSLMNRMINNNQKSAAMNAKMSGFHQETFSNIQTIKAFDASAFFIRQLKTLQKEYITMKLDFQKMSIYTSVIMALTGLLVSYSSYGWGIYRVYCGAISYGTMTLFLSMSGSLSSALNNLISMVPSAISLTTSAGRLMDIIEMKQEDYSLDPEYLAFAKKHKDSGISLVLDDICYAYQNGPMILEHACFEAHPHEVVALVGPSGEGKTTLLRLMLSLLSPKSGSAILSAASQGLVETLPLTASSRKLFSYVPQGNTMSSGTIADNMRIVKEDATDEEIIQTLKDACAWEFVQKLPDGIHSQIKERGGGLSEGQSQRLSIARALLKKAPILLLDEATSALDVTTERRVLRNIMSADYPRTCIITTHRPTVLTLCHRVYSIRQKKCISLSQAEIQQLIDDF